MCGVIGSIGPRSEEQVSIGLGKMSYRGIRSRMTRSVGGSVGHVRLPIVGLGEENDQPVRSGRWTVAFVGEILDFRDYLPTAPSDVGLVVDTWTRAGPSGFTKFDGFWGVVAYNEEGESLHALVDYLSQKPLYVREDSYARAVASEPDAVVALGPVDLDEIYLSSVVKWGYCPEPGRTPYVGVRRMCPGEYVVIPRKGPSVWSVADKLSVDTRSSPEFLRFEIDRATYLRVTSSDVPVACLVSGGLDSSIVYTYARMYGNVKTYHVENGETENARKVDPEVYLLGSQDVSEEKGLDYLQEPIDLGSLIPQVSMSDAIAGAGRERVCLTGDGADELFGGYGRSQRYDSQASDVFHELVAWHLVRLDRVMMRNQIEVRSPFLARRVVEIALGLPRNLRTDKRVLRETFRGLLPPEVLSCPKKPLRTEKVRIDREGNSSTLVRLFRERHRCRG